MLSKDEFLCEWSHHTLIRLGEIRHGEQNSLILESHLWTHSYFLCPSSSTHCAEHQARQKETWSPSLEGVTFGEVDLCTLWHVLCVRREQMLMAHQQRHEFLQMEGVGVGMAGEGGGGDA